MIESTTSDLVERYLTPEKAYELGGKSWLVNFHKVHKEGGGKQVRVRGVDGAGRPINHLYTMHERKLKGHKHGSTYADCVKLCRIFARDCVDNLTNRLDELGKLGPTKLFRAGKWPKIKAQQEKKCKEWLNGCSKLFRNKLPGFDIKAAERELPTFSAIMEAHHEMESFTQGLSNFLGSAESKRPHSPLLRASYSLATSLIPPCFTAASPLLPASFSLATPRIPCLILPCFRPPSPLLRASYSLATSLIPPCFTAASPLLPASFSLATPPHSLPPSPLLRASYSLATSLIPPCFRPQSPFASRLILPCYPPHSPLLPASCPLASGLIPPC
ncbi:unnamed protein product [Closterium sp. NIES-64]|nr:unnamed protein product [Closterium sp. NIES-64]